MAFLGWFWGGEWHTYPSKEHEDKLDAVLIPMGAKRIKGIDPNFNYVEYLNKKYNKMSNCDKSPEKTIITNEKKK